MQLRNSFENSDSDVIAILIVHLKVIFVENLLSVLSIFVKEIRVFLLLLFFNNQGIIALMLSCVSSNRSFEPL